MRSNKFNFYDIVKVNQGSLSLKEIEGFEGVVRGMSKNEETGEWGYAVSVFKDGGFVWDIMEEYLIATNRKLKPRDPVEGECFRVRVNPETGEGKIINRESNEN